MLNKIDFEALLSHFSCHAEEFLSEENCFLDQTGHFCYLRFNNDVYRNNLLGKKKITANFLNFSKELIISEPFCQTLFEMNNRKMVVKVPSEIKDDEILLKMVFQNLFDTEKVQFDKSNIFEDTFYIRVEEDIKIENVILNLKNHTFTFDLYSFFDTKSILVSKKNEKDEGLNLNYIVTYLNNKSSDSNSKVKEIREFQDFWLFIFYGEINSKFWKRHEIFFANKTQELFIEPFGSFRHILTKLKREANIESIERKASNLRLLETSQNNVDSDGVKLFFYYISFQI